MIQSTGGFSRRSRVVLLFMLVLVVIQGFSALAQGDLIRRTYVWDYGGKAWSFTYDFPTSAYQLQKSLTRTLNYTNYDVYVNDPREDVVLRDFVAKFEASVPELTIWERLNLVIALIQSIPYVGESCEYPRYPIEMLVDQQGDCEDSAILTAALVRHMGFGVVLLAFLEEHHMAVGIRVLPPEHQTLQSFVWNGDPYYYLEPTSLGWAIGQIPPSYQSVPIIVGLTSIVALP